MLIDIHLLQNHAPSNLNRDDTGAPKDAIFGGAPRARISSQCLKRSIRRSEIFREAFAGEGLLARRTQLLPRLVREELERQGVAEPAREAIVRRVPELGRESSKGRGEETEREGEAAAAAESTPGERTAQLIFLSDAEIPPLAAKLTALYARLGVREFEKMKIDDLARSLGGTLPRSVDVAMFGRMTTSAAFTNVQAAVQVAHAISTHRLEQEFDYYTAVDDISGEAGAGFIGDTAFNSATYYKYLSVHWEGLVGNLCDVAVAMRAVRAFIEAAALAQPSGKQNSFAAHNPPDLVLVEVRPRNIPLSYANAFLKPVRPRREQSLVDASIAALADYLGRVVAAYGLPAQRAYFTTTDQELPGTRLRGLSELLAWLPLGQPEPSVA